MISVKTFLSQPLQMENIADPVKKQDWFDRYRGVGLSLITAGGDDLDKASEVMRQLFALPASVAPLHKPFMSCVQYSKTPLDDLRFSEWTQEELFRWSLVNRVRDSIQKDELNVEPFYVAGGELTEGWQLAQALCAFHAVVVLDPEAEETAIHSVGGVEGLFFVSQPPSLHNTGAIVIAESLDHLSPVWRGRAKAVIIVDKL